MMNDIQRMCKSGFKAFLGITIIVIVFYGAYVAGTGIVNFLKELF
jgi:hypothetical protein